MRKITMMTAILATLPCVAKAKETLTKTIAANSISTLVFENGAGDLALSVHQGDQVVINAERLDFDEKHCTYQIKQIGGEVLVKVERHVEGFFTSDCDVDIKISVPSDSAFAYDLKIGAGNLTLDGIAGTIDFKLGSGNLEAKNVRITELDGKSGAGNINVIGTIDEGDITLGTGNAIVKLTAVAKGKIDIKTGTGNAEIKIPSEGKVATEVSTGLGNVVNQVGNEADAPYKISVKAGIGNASISRF